MKKLPEVDLTYEPLTRMVFNAIPAQLLLTAIELKVFSHLNKPMSAGALASELGTHPLNTSFLLDALAANDLLTKHNGKYTNAPLADAFLIEGRPTYVGDVLLSDVEWMRPALEDMPALVRHGPSASTRPRP